MSPNRFQLGFDLLSVLASVSEAVLLDQPTKLFPLLCNRAGLLLLLLV